MTILRFVHIAAALVCAMSAATAGPCQHEIDRMQARVDAVLEAAAGSGPAAAESLAARLHRQPTPDSIAAAEKKLGEISSGTIAAAAASSTASTRACMRSISCWQ